MTPTKSCGVGHHTTPVGRLYRFAVAQGSCEPCPSVPVARAGRRRPGQRVEGFATAFAKEPRQATCMAPDDRTARSTVRTDTPLANIRLREIDHAFQRRYPGNEPSGFSPLFR